LLGVARNALLKQAISRFIVSADQDIFYLHRKLLLESAEPRACELRMIRPDGTFPSGRGCKPLPRWTWMAPAHCAS
jgi:hypothetical protein